jgi:transcriptional regulator with XRE-family HTH domain
LPFCHIVLKASKPPSFPFPKELSTLGDYLKKRRLDLRFRQKDVAERLGVDETTVQFWENNRIRPSLSLIPKIIEFLGYNPSENTPESLEEKIKTFRRTHGISQKKLAILLEIDPSTIGCWERGEHLPTKRLLDKLLSFFTSFPSSASGREK